MKTLATLGAILLLIVAATFGRHSSLALQKAAMARCQAYIEGAPSVKVGDIHQCTAEMQDAVWAEWASRAKASWESGAQRRRPVSGATNHESGTTDQGSRTNTSSD